MPRATPPPKSGQPATSKRRRPPQGGDGQGSRWLWPFELGERLGEGGMGVVYKGRYVVNDRMVAVKMLPDDVSDPVILARFEQELEILKDLKHPNIVRCFGGVSEDDHRFYAMELVEGGSLEDDIKRRGKLPWEQVVEYAEQMAAALQASHEKGIVHRDVKPGNFLKTKSGRLKLSDFGLARIGAGRNITRAGKTAGTVLYMAPEQIRGKDIGPPADLYALGCVLYELLAGRTPFTGEAAAPVLHAHVTQEPARLGQFATDCPPALEELVHQLLEKDQSKRPQSAAEVGTRLATFADTMHVARRDNSYSSVPSSRPLTTPRETTQDIPVPQLTARSLDLSKPATLPRWSILSVAATAVVFAIGFVWEASRVSALQPWRDQMMKLASETGEHQSMAIQEAAKLGSDDNDVLELVISELSNPDSGRRAAAATAAQYLNSGDIKLIGALNRLAQNDESSEVRYQAKRTADLLKERRE